MEKGFTLVIPLYNKVNTIRATLDSVLNNHGEYPFKCIIVDDDSTDGSSIIAEGYDMTYPEIFRYIKIKHHGHKTPVYARNTGIKLADTEYIGFLDADDELCAGFIDRGCSFLDENPKYNEYHCGHIAHDIDENGEDAYTEMFFWNDGEYTEFEGVLRQSGIANIHFCAGIYKTQLAQQCLFADTLSEDTVFSFEYAYKNLPIYLDNSTARSIIFRREFSDSGEWNIQRTENHWLLEPFLVFKDRCKCNEYSFWYDEDNETVMYEKIY